MTKFCDLQAGDLFTIEGKKSPLGFITVQDGITHYGLDSETVVSAPLSAYSHEELVQELVKRGFNVVLTPRL